MKEKKYYRFSVVCEIVTLIFTVVTVICTVANVRMTRDANQREKAMAEAMHNALTDKTLQTQLLVNLQEHRQQFMFCHTEKQFKQLINDII